MITFTSKYKTRIFISDKSDGCVNKVQDFELAQEKS